jgi:hypothetical protein
MTDGSLDQVFTHRPIGEFTALAGDLEGQALEFGPAVGFQDSPPVG